MTLLFDNSTAYTDVCEYRLNRTTSGPSDLVVNFVYGKHQAWVSDLYVTERDAMRAASAHWAKYADQMRASGAPE